MLDSAWKDIKREFQYGNILTRLIIINVAVFVIVNFIGLIFYIQSGKEGYFHFINDILCPWFCAQSQWKELLLKPWTIITSMFLHYDLWHMVWNVLFLYWFGRIFCDFTGRHKLLATYILGGLAGFTAYFIVGLLVGDPGEVVGLYALGASAAVMAIVAAAATLAPNYSMHVLLIGPVKLKYIALVLIVINILSIPKGNAGGMIAHLGGVLMGFLSIYWVQKRGYDITTPFNNFIDKLVDLWSRRKDIFSRRKEPRVVYKNTTGKRAKGNSKSDLHIVPDQSEIDAILDKIKRSGYDSLTKEELDILARASKS